MAADEFGERGVIAVGDESVQKFAVAGRLHPIGR